MNYELPEWCCRAGRSTSYLFTFLLFHLFTLKHCCPIRIFSYGFRIEVYLRHTPYALKCYYSQIILQIYRISTNYELWIMNCLVGVVERRRSTSYSNPLIFSVIKCPKKEGLFRLQTRLLCTTNKACLQLKQGLFANQAVRKCETKCRRPLSTDTYATFKSTPYVSLFAIPTWHKPIHFNWLTNFIGRLRKLYGK